MSAREIGAILYFVGCLLMFVAVWLYVNWRRDGKI